MEKHDISVLDMANTLNIDYKVFKGFLDGVIDVDISLANKLALVFDTSVDIWINLQKHYDKLINYIT